MSYDPTYRCPVCDQPFDDDDWDDRHTASDNSDVHPGCCDLCRMEDAHTRALTGIIADGADKCPFIKAVAADNLTEARRLADLDGEECEETVLRALIAMALQAVTP